jgi:hypothetical protein
MAQAKVYPPPLDIFNPPAMDENGWTEVFPVRFHGSDVLNGQQIDAVAVAFLNSDAANEMDNKIRDAVRNRAQTIHGLTVGAQSVVSYAPPRRL